MKLIITLSIFFLCIGSTVEYNPIFLPKLIKKATIIVHVKITKLNEANFEAVVLENIKSKALSDTIEIKYFKNWNCARRWLEYEVGQEAIFFLYSWGEILGAGNEGEMPIANGKLYYQSPFFVKTDYFKDEKPCRITKDGGIYGTKYDLTEAVAGLKEYMKYYLKPKEELELLFQNGTLINHYPTNLFTKRAVNELILLNKDKFTPKEFMARDFDR